MQKEDFTMKSEKMFQLDQHIEKIKRALQLPEQFLNTCTLKEGTIVVISCLQTVTIMFVAFVVSMLIIYPVETDKWWKQKFKDDFDPYIMGESVELIDKLHSLWLPVTYALITAESVYFFTGFGVIYALYDKKAHPGFYLPWLMMSGFLVTSNFLTVAAMVTVSFIHATYREITVTWDMVPTIMVFVYACMWFYGFIVVVAHYRRRVIVHWWRHHGLDLTKEHQ